MGKYSDNHVKTLCQWALAFSHGGNLYNNQFINLSIIGVFLTAWGVLDAYRYVMKQ